MFQRIKTYLVFGNLYTGVEHTVKNGKETSFVTVLKRSGNTLDLEKTTTEVTLDKVMLGLSKKQHIVLVINNDQVLTKCLDNKQSIPDKLVYSAFPNIKIEDFYYEVLSQDHCHFVSICRKHYVEELVQGYKEKGVHVIGISLGNLIISSISNFTDKTTYTSSNASIILENHMITSINISEHENVSYHISGLDIDNNHLLSLSGALDAILHTHHTTTNLDELKASWISDFKQSKYFSTFLRVGLASILILLLINFFVFSHYYNAVDTLRQTSLIHTDTKNSVLELDRHVHRSQKLVDDMLKSSGSKSSFYVNTMIHSMPETILLSEFNYQPLLKRIKNDQDIIVDSQVILISGTSIDSNLFSKWVLDMQIMGWVKQVEILGYRDTSAVESEFDLKLKLQYDGNE